MEAKDPAVTDAMTVRLTFNGAGSAEPTDADKQTMFNSAQTVYERLKSCC